MSSEFIDIVLFGAIAIFLVYRLRSILGSSDGKIVNIRTKKNPQSKFKPKIVPKNDNDEFLAGANKAYEMIVQAYQSNSIEKVKSFLLSDEPFSIKNECLTASGLKKRQQINQVYKERLEQLYKRNY